MSKTSEEVMPWCKYLALIPTFSVTDVRKAIMGTATKEAHLSVGSIVRGHYNYQTNFTILSRPKTTHLIKRTLNITIGSSSNPNNIREEVAARLMRSTSEVTRGMFFSNEKPYYYVDATPTAVGSSSSATVQGTTKYTETLTFDDFGSLRFEEILKPNKLILEQGDNTDFAQVILLEDNVDGNAESNQLVLEGGGRLELEEEEFTKLTGSGVTDQNNANVSENVGILLENFGQILLDGTDQDSANADEYLVQETTENNRFTLELSGSIIEEEFSSNSVIEHLLLEGESGGRILYDAGLATSGLHSFDRSDRILLEQGDGDIILLDGIDSDSTDAGRALLFESDEEIHTAIALETTNKIPSEGQIPIDNWTLNSSVSSVGGLPIVQSSEIRTRTTGDIALEDGFGNLVLNGTDGSSTNAGDNMDLEGATGITI